MQLTLGKIRKIQQLTQNGLFKIIALDHRDVFVNMLNSANKSSNVEDVIAEKLKIINLSNENISGYLIDPHYALPQCILTQVLPNNLGFMVNYEDNDYSMESFSNNYFIKGFSISKIKDLGASAVKLFIYYNPDSDYAQKQEKIIENVCKECENLSIPFLLEPVLSFGDKKVDWKTRVATAFKMVERLSKFDVDVFKIDFPGDIYNLSKEENSAICAKVSEVLTVPWVIMSSGIPIEDFYEQLEIACKNGASGYVVGRALWKDYVLASGSREEETKTMVNRIKNLNKIVEENGMKVSSINDYSKINFDQKDWYIKTKI